MRQEKEGQRQAVDILTFFSQSLSLTTTTTYISTQPLPLYYFLPLPASLSPTIPPPPPPARHVSSSSFPACISCAHHPLTWCFGLGLCCVYLTCKSGSIYSSKLLLLCYPLYTTFYHSMPLEVKDRAKGEGGGRMGTFARLSYAGWHMVPFSSPA